MTGHVPQVRPLSRARIEEIMLDVVARFSPETLSGSTPFPVEAYCDSDELGQYGFRFRVDDLPFGTEGRIDDEDLVIDTDVYEALLNGDLRARFTCAHEIGHAILHGTQLRAMNAGKRGSVHLHRRESLPAYRDPEWQANAAAAAILMPVPAVQAISKISSPILLERTIHEHLLVSRLAAKHRIRQLAQNGAI